MPAHRPRSCLQETGAHLLDLAPGQPDDACLVATSLVAASQQAQAAQQGMPAARRLFSEPMAESDADKSTSSLPSEPPASTGPGLSSEQHVHCSPGQVTWEEAAHRAMQALPQAGEDQIWQPAGSQACRLCQPGGRSGAAMSPASPSSPVRAQVRLPAGETWRLDKAMARHNLQGPAAWGLPKRQSVWHSGQQGSSAQHSFSRVSCMCRGRCPSPSLGSRCTHARCMMTCAPPYHMKCSSATSTLARLLVQRHALQDHKQPEPEHSGSSGLAPCTPEESSSFVPLPRCTRQPPDDQVGLG